MYSLSQILEITCRKCVVGSDLFKKDQSVHGKPYQSKSMESR